VDGYAARQTAGLNADAVVNLGIYCALAAIAGAKLMMFLVDIPYYSRTRAEIFTLATLQAGGVFYGGLIAALAVAWWYMRKTRLPAAEDGRRVRARDRPGPRHRPAGLLFGRLLLGRRVPPALGRDVHQPGGQPACRSAA
jgi:hypothetical protein